MVVGREGPLFRGQVVVCASARDEVLVAFYGHCRFLESDVRKSLTGGKGSYVVSVMGGSPRIVRDEEELEGRSR